MKHNKKKTKLKKQTWDLEPPIKVGQVVKLINGKGKNKTVYLRTVEEAVELVSGAWMYRLDDMRPGYFAHESIIKKLSKTERGK